MDYFTGLKDKFNYLFDLELSTSKRFPSEYKALIEGPCPLDLICYASICLSVIL